MKKLFYLFAILTMAFGFTACGSDDDDDDIAKDAIVGTWKLTEVKTKESAPYMSWPFEVTYASFKSDGTYSGSGYFGTGQGTWSKKGNIVTTYVSGKAYISYEIIDVTATTAELKMSMDGSSSYIWIKCKKN